MLNILRSSSEAYDLFLSLPSDNFQKHGPKHGKQEFWAPALPLISCLTLSKSPLLSGPGRLVKCLKDPEPKQKQKRDVWRKRGGWWRFMLGPLFFRRSFGTWYPGFDLQYSWKAVCQVTEKVASEVFAEHGCCLFVPSAFIKNRLHTRRYRHGLCPHGSHSQGLAWPMGEPLAMCVCRALEMWQVWTEMRSKWNIHNGLQRLIKKNKVQYLNEF